MTFFTLKTILVPRAPRFVLNCVSCSSGNGKKSLNFLNGRLKMNAQQGTTLYPSTHNVFLPIEFQMLGHVYQPVRLHQQFQRFSSISV